VLLTLISIHADDAKYEILVEQIESDLEELGQEVRHLYQTRCNNTSLETCAHSNYDDCASLFPNSTCKSEKDFDIAHCGGDGGTCGSRWDYTVSQVWLNSEIASNNHEVIETICLTQGLESYFKRKLEDRKIYWDELGLRTPQMYFGAQNGVFRIYPARPLQDKNCSSFDPRLRPWFVGGSSGAKVVVLTLDTSTSMCDPNCKLLELVKEAAITVIQTLTRADRVALVLFSNDATIFEQGGVFLFEASQENKDMLEQRIGSLTNDALGSGTNFQAAFEAVFKVLNDSIYDERVACTTAMLFLTDGKMNRPEGVTEETVVDLVKSNITALEASGHHVYLFTYSISNNDSVHYFPKKIACNISNGVWSKIDDETRILDSLTSYYRLFALGLGDGNKTFVTWVEPYTSYTGNILVTTASSPVYDNSTSPPLFLGVVGIDFPLAAVDKALGVAGGSQESINKIVQKSMPGCTRTVKLTQCELEFFRQSGDAGGEALCTTSCNETDFVNMKQSTCSTSSNFTSILELWNNRNASGLNYAQRACCGAGETIGASASQCTASSVNIGAVVGGTKDANIGAVVGGTIGGLVVLLICFYLCCKKKLCHKVRARYELWRSSRQLRQLVVLQPPKPSAPPFNPDS